MPRKSVGYECLDCHTCYASELDASRCEKRHRLSVALKQLHDIVDFALEHKDTYAIDRIYSGIIILATNHYSGKDDEVSLIDDIRKNELRVALATLLQVCEKYLGPMICGGEMTMARSVLTRIAVPRCPHGKMVGDYCKECSSNLSPTVPLQGSVGSTL